ncbi:MAG: hypothetical protein CL934_00460 [Deltaproteobacteria bacterium]|nr:hypothetical protein [Deltaproteobacteria bacterium]
MEETMPIHQEGVRDSSRIPDMNLMPQEDLQAYLNAIEPFGGEMLRRKSRRLSQIQINSRKSPEYPNLSDQGLRQHLIETEWDDELPLSA